MDFPNSNFWNYSSQVWTLPEVEKLSLELQNEFDTNINILFYSCWLGDKNRCLSDDDLQVLLDTIQPWQTIIKPLRDSREMMQKSLIAMPKQLAKQTLGNISEMELNAEHMTQLAMEKALNPEKLATCAKQSNIESSLKNIKTYLTSLEGGSSNEPMLNKIGQLLSAIYGDEQSVQLALMSKN